MQYGLVRTSLRHLCASLPAVLVRIITTLLLLLFGWWMTDIDLSLGNMGVRFTSIQIIVYIIFCLFFGLFAAIFVYKWKYFGVVHKKHTARGTLGGFFGIIVAGCPGCAITLASYIGLATLLTWLPRYGLELKVVGVVLVIWATRKSLVTMESCAIKNC